MTDITNDHGSWLTWGCGGFSDVSLCSFTISFRGTSSSDPDDDIVSWSIDFGDGTSAGGSWSTDPPSEVAHDYGGLESVDCAGFGGFDFLCPVTLTVTDSAGQSDSDTMLMLFLKPDTRLIGFRASAETQPVAKACRTASAHGADPVHATSGPSSATATVWSVCGA